MIYLFEDRKGRMNQYFNKAIDSTLIKEVIFDCKKENIDSYINNCYNNAQAIIFHKSYVFEDPSISSDDVKAAFLRRKTPFVYFSGGLKNNIIKENNLINGTVNSGDMYNNLSDFLDLIKQSEQANIPLLVYGKKYLLNSLLEMLFIINMYFFGRKLIDILTNDDYLFILDDAIDVSLFEEEFKQDKSNLINWVKFEKSRQEINIQFFLSHIQKIIDKY